MGRKAVNDGKKRDEIITAALELFFTKGFDGTSIRTIMRQAGGEVGLFYYYFDNKDDVFDKVLDRFFDHYEEDFEKIVTQGRRNPCRLMYDFFTYMEVETEKFRKRYEENMHRTVRWAIREHTLEIIEPYIRRVVDIQSEYYGVKPALAPEVAAMYLTYGVGSSILHEEADRYMSRHKDIQEGTCLIMNMSKEEQALRIPYLAEAADIPELLALATKMQEYFPGLDKKQCETVLQERIPNKEVWVYRHQGNVVAGILYSKKDQMIDWLAVDTAYQRKGLAHRLVETVAAQFPIDSRLSVITYRAEDEKGRKARSFYTSLGFEGKELVELEGYPCQRMELVIPERV